jgi:hypothetical protein
MCPEQNVTHVSGRPHLNSHGFSSARGDMPVAFDALGTNALPCLKSLLRRKPLLIHRALRRIRDF